MNAQPQTLPKDIRALMIAVANGRVLVPNALVSEIITAASPEPIAGAPAWISGRVSWRGWRVPLFSLSILAGLAEVEPTLNSKITVLKALGGNIRMPFIAMTCIGFPRLTTVASDELLPAGRAKSGVDRQGVLMEVLLREDRAILPDLPMIESLITEALGLGAVA
ncbi:MAG: chemotaxis protein CheW [Lysobacterales bacterium]